MSSVRPQGQAWALSLLLLVATLAVYYPVYDYPFINFDDNRYVTDNPHIRTLDLALVKWALLHPYLYNWHPLTWVSHAADIQMFGFDAGYHHEVNVLLHALSAVVLFWVLKRATGYVGRSFMVAALFALHPINVESVAWVSERKTVLSTLFFFLALGAYRWYTLRPKLRRMAAVAVLYGLGLMAKPQIITLPFVLLLWDYWPLRRMFADDSAAVAIAARSFTALVKEKIPLFAICAVSALLTMVAQHGFGTTGPYTLPVRLANGLVSYVRYIQKLFWPTNLAIMYLHPLNSLRWWQGCLALLLLGAVTGWVATRRRHRYLVVGWLWFLGTLVPVIGLVHFYLQAMADRYAYISGVGIFLMVCWGVADLAQQFRLPRAVLPVASVAVLLTISLLTHRQLSYWQDSVTLWTHTLQVTHRNWVAETYLAVALRDQGQPEASLTHFYRAAGDMTRRDPEVYLGIALGEQNRGNPAIAIEFYKKALIVMDTPGIRRQILQNMGAAYRSLGDEAAAQQSFYQAAHQPPEAVDWQANWWRQLVPLLREHWRSWRDRSPAGAPSR